MQDPAPTGPDQAAAEALARESGILLAVQRVLHMALADNPAVQAGVADRGEEIARRLGGMVAREYGAEKVQALRTWFATPAGRAHAAVGAALTPETRRFAERLAAELRAPR